MIPTKAFVLCAGMGRRFKPQSLYCPKPALPIFNLPQALYSTSSLKEFGVQDFFYNSHHLPQELEQHLGSHFKTKPFYEKLLLDSAGGIANVKEAFKNESDFWVINGDSFIHYENIDFLKEALELHKQKNAIATLIGVSDKNPNLNGLLLDSKNKFLGLSKDNNSLHFIGLYLLNTEIFKYIQLKPTNIFSDLLLKPQVQDKVLVYKAPSHIKWFETGNESDFLDCVKFEAKSIIEKRTESFIYKTHMNWAITKDLDQKLERFLKDKHWGLNPYSSSNPGNFVCIPENSPVNEKVKLKNTVLLPHLKLNSDKDFENKVLVHSSQWR